MDLCVWKIDLGCVVIGPAAFRVIYKPAPKASENKDE